MVHRALEKKVGSNFVAFSGVLGASIIESELDTNAGEIQCFLTTKDDLTLNQEVRFQNITYKIASKHTSPQNLFGLKKYVVVEVL